MLCLSVHNGFPTILQRVVRCTNALYRFELLWKVLLLCRYTDREILIMSRSRGGVRTLLEISNLLIIVDLSKIGIGPLPPTRQQSYPSGPLKTIVDPRMHIHIRFGLLDSFLFPFSVLWDKNIIIFKKAKHHFKPRCHI